MPPNSPSSRLRSSVISESTFGPFQSLTGYNEMRFLALNNVWSAIRLILSAANKQNKQFAAAAAFFVWPSDVPPPVLIDEGRSTAALLQRLRSGFRLPLDTVTASNIFRAAVAAATKKGVTSSRQAAAWVGELFEWTATVTAVSATATTARARVGAVPLALERQINAAVCAGRGLHWLDEPPALSTWGGGGRSTPNHHLRAALTARRSPLSSSDK